MGRKSNIWGEAPIRAELFSVERLEEHAKNLAGEQVAVNNRIKGLTIFDRLADNEFQLGGAYRQISAASDRGASVTPAAEWLIDNFYIVERQIRDVRSDLPAGYYRQLPKLTNGPFAGYPRILSVAWRFVAHTDSLFEPETLRRYLLAYQSVQPLTIGELWAVAITLRFVLVENLRRIALRIVASRTGRLWADAVADRLLGVGSGVFETIDAVLPDHARTRFPGSFLVQLVHRLRDQPPELSPSLAWLDAQLARHGAGSDALVRQEHQLQVAGSLTVRNIITSMRLISDVDWPTLVEQFSLVDAMFSQATRFDEMDFATRNLYRGAVETLARGSNLTETDVARSVLDQIGQVQAQGVVDRNSPLLDPGHLLIGAGRGAFEGMIGYHPPFPALAGRLFRRLGIAGYLGANLVATVAALGLAVAVSARIGAPPLHLLWLALLGLIPAADLGVALVNHIVTRSFHAAQLPALELREGVPREHATLLVIPILLTSPSAIEDAVERLEVHHLSCPPGEIGLALLSDWTDGDHETADEDEALLWLAQAGVDRLNRQYPALADAPRFHLLHRKRTWCQTERKWIGWERKRGKLRELNRLLRGATDTSFIGPIRLAPHFRYVITLDSDTRLPLESAPKLIGKMAHPLNRPQFDQNLERVTGGYAILQPRVTPGLATERGESLFSRIFSRSSGVDPYASAVSDVYQDLFGEGSYTGKGIYDVDAFEAAQSDRAPPGSLLSHDLFEGIFARAGLVSDVEVVEDFPERYDVDALRRHRWSRGDWQLLPWILGNGPQRQGLRKRSHVPLIGRFKMADNLRRTLSAPFTTLALIVGCLLRPREAVVWTLFLVATMAAPLFIPAIAGPSQDHRRVSASSRARAFSSEIDLAFAQAGLNILFLGHQAWLMADAMGRTLLRLLFTRRRLLEWTPAASTALGRSRTLGAYYRWMGGALCVSALALGTVILLRGASWPLALIFAAAWASSPAVAFLISQRSEGARRLRLEPEAADRLRRVARQTWRYFETFVTPQENYLPPDNYQETPAGVIANRTSPTNIGLYLLSIVSARDFGWIGTREAAERLEDTFSTLGRMVLFRGHLLNWYDTRDLRPLEPRYVSSVDSGNFAGHLIALAGACREWRALAQSDAARLDGVADALALALREIQAEEALAPPSVILRRCHKAAAALQQRIEAAQLAGEALSAAAGDLSPLCLALQHAAFERAVEAPSSSESDLVYWTLAIGRCLVSHASDGQAVGDPALIMRIEALERQARAMAMATDFSFLLEPTRLLLSIGYRLSDDSLDPNCYDLLASEARLASFFAIAKQDVPARHWFRLGRALTPVEEGGVLVSWSGSMFEYLMPSLVMLGPIESLIEKSNRLAVRRQISYGALMKTPWGVSESAFNSRNLSFTYQYANFGVPGLGLKRGLAGDSVIAPYATALASMVDAPSALRNLERLEAIGARGRYGFYEALDYTLARVPQGAEKALVQAFMAHHQGMSIVAIAVALQEGRMQHRFHSDPMIKAAELLLQERAPLEIGEVSASVDEGETLVKARALDSYEPQRIVNAWGGAPAVHLLSNGRYSVMLTAAGGGQSAWRDRVVTRWREDATCDDWGAYVYLRDVTSGLVWSAGFQPTTVEPETYEVEFNEDRARFTRKDAGLVTTLEVLVSTEDDAEVRRISVSNESDRVREVDVTSYAELALTQQSADLSHPAFSKIFIETEHLPALGCLIATRRKRDPSEPEIWAAHLAVMEGPSPGPKEFETDRARFIGRGGSLRAPVAVTNGRPLSGASGVVLDPIFALRRRVRILPGATARIDFWTLAASSRQAVLSLVDKHHDTGAFERAAALAWTQAQVQLQHLGISRTEAAQYQRLAGHLVFATSQMRSHSETIAGGSGSQPGLWSMGISGDLPILLLRVSGLEQLSLVRDVLQAVEYFRMKRLAVDLVILNERASSYVQDLQGALETLVRASQSRPQLDDAPVDGHLFVLRADLIAPDAGALLASVARVVLTGELGRLSEQLDYAPDAPAAPRSRPFPAPPQSELHVLSPPKDVEFFNGLGGFSDNGREYMTVLGPGQTTPAPWINVVSNPSFGFQSSVEGGGYVWSVNSRERQLTPWSNDPVLDRPGQVVYLREQATGEVWCPTASPIRDEAGIYVARHGFGYTTFEHASHGVVAELTEFVPLKDPIKISRLKLRNLTGRERVLQISTFTEWALGPNRSGAAAHTITRLDAETGALFTTNAWNPAFAERVAFTDLCGKQTSWTADRREFLGRNGSASAPLALLDPGPLSGKTGAGLDPCSAMQTTVVLPPHDELEITFFLGDAADADAARALIKTYRAADLDRVLEAVRGFWKTTLGKVQVKTPDRSIDIMLNGWLAYQTLACRVWARAGFYQTSGAYGFRDQLQDGMALADILPEFTRAHLLRAAGRQFDEGDVQHWWLPHSGQGVRSRFTDDRVWLAKAAAHYVSVTGDHGVLDEPVGYLKGEPLGPAENERFFAPEPSDSASSLYQHCRLALNTSLATGIHGLPLIGGGDWNDGFNRVGLEGRGESVWLGWMLYSTLADFSHFAELQGDEEQALIWRNHMSALKASTLAEAWDGRWFKRGWFDDGSPLGSAGSEECRIDSIAQSWAVISGAAPADLAREAMASVERELIQSVTGLALIFAPPFDRSPHDPGYVQGYPPGLRENGGQYTHAALWSVIAFAQLGEGDKAAALFWMLNPINHARTQGDVHRYKVEPYVVAADIYSAQGQSGRGGWTWYTGSSGWMLRAGLESILGLRREGASLIIDPCIPKSWPGFTITYLFEAARYEIRVENQGAGGNTVIDATVDGAPVTERPVRLALDPTSRTHAVRVIIGADNPRP